MITPLIIVQISTSLIIVQISAPLIVQKLTPLIAQLPRGSRVKPISCFWRCCLLDRMLKSLQWRHHSLKYLSSSLATLTSRAHMILYLLQLCPIWKNVSRPFCLCVGSCSGPNLHRSTAAKGKCKSPILIKSNSNVTLVTAGLNFWPFSGHRGRFKVTFGFVLHWPAREVQDDACGSNVFLYFLYFLYFRTCVLFVI